LKKVLIAHIAYENYTNTEKNREDKQRFRCRDCGKTHIRNYSYKGYNPSLNQNIIALTKEGVGFGVQLVYWVFPPLP